MCAARNVESPFVRGPAAWELRGIFVLLKNSGAHPAPASLANSSCILASRFLRVTISRGQAPVLSNVRMFVLRLPIASLSDIANRLLVSRSRGTRTGRGRIGKSQERLAPVCRAEALRKRAQLQQKRNSPEESVQPDSLGALLGYFLGLLAVSSWPTPSQ